MLNKDDIRRYSRQLLLNEIDEEGQSNLRSAHAVVIGLGGLGTLASRFLVGAGVGNITLIDGDIVEVSNLQRQVTYNETHLGDLKAKALSNELHKVDPSIHITSKSLFACKRNLQKLIGSATCVLDCTDSVAIRKDINAACIAAKKPLFIAAASGLSWQAINLPCHSFLASAHQLAPSSHCTSENHHSSETDYSSGTDYSSQTDHADHVNQQCQPPNVSSKVDAPCGCYDCLVAQLNVTQDCRSQGVLGPVVGIAACHQATQALLFLAKRHTATIQWGRYIVGNAIDASVQSFHLPPSPDCKVCQ
ncbi:HesA/MoeB/ThiF family protein [Alteromonas sp. BMJM2]|uniref:HesA/MoeB/ThiF family protein n=1 Tax=Alteromonas sp. BMJM2 TaxID=2954241 RepID=UPI0022B42098|nr:HesA/MoeB/ThiF family protein [Alteromonas sp. BMJM2]